MILSYFLSLDNATQDPYFYSMSNCPVCDSPGACVLLSKIFCPNPECQWFDQQQHDEAVKDIQEALDGLIDNLGPDPDKTPPYGNTTYPFGFDPDD